MKEQLKFVQILRGFAAITVVLFSLPGFILVHFNYSIFTFNFDSPGLDFFFALSGFTITYVHLKETQHHSSVKKFLLKRFVRVFPFYWLVLMLIIGLESPEFHHKPTLRSAIDPTTADGLINILKNIALFPLPDTYMVIGIASGLSHILVFYILFACGIKLGWNAAKVIFVLWLMTIILYSFHIFPHSPLLEAVMVTVNVQILIGCVAGYLFAKGKIPLNKWQFIFLLLAAVAVTAAFTGWQGYDRNNLLLTTLTGVTFSLILLCAALYDRKKLSQKPTKRYASVLLVLTGDAAYSIFLTHIIFIPYLCIAVNNMLNVAVIPDMFKNVLIVIVFLLTIVAGILIYSFIELPLLNFLRKQFRLRRHKKTWM
jgi:peptidoglycan/LPS O-acetylase OafA/YrhL